MWFEYSSNESMLMMDKKISLVATPEGTPSPPELTSTVARPMLQRKVFADKFVKEDVDGSFIQRPTSKKIQFSEDVNESQFKVPLPKSTFDQTANDARSSLGLLPPETLACTMTANATIGAEPVFRFGLEGPKLNPSKSLPPPSPEEAEQQILSELDRLRFSENSPLKKPRFNETGPKIDTVPSLVETKIANKDVTSSGSAILPNDISSDRSMFVDALPDKYLLPTPHHLAENQSCFGHGLSYFLDSTCDSVKSGKGSGRVELPSGVDFLITPKLPRVEDSEQKKNLFDRDISNPFDNDPNVNPLDASSTPFDENFVTNPFEDFPCQDVSVGAGEKFDNLSTDVIKKFLDAEEEENAREFRFLQEEEQDASDASSRNHPPDFKNNSGDKNGSSASMTDYFRIGTSRIGFSFDQSLSGSSIQKYRPNFGFGTISSPEKQPIAVVEPFNEDDKERTLTPEADDLPCKPTSDGANRYCDLVDDTSSPQNEAEDGRDNVTSGHLSDAKDETDLRLKDKSAQKTKFELLVSFLEDTVAQTLSRSGINDPAEASMDLVAMIISQTSPELDARAFAKKVLESLKRQKPTTSPTFDVTPLSHLLPSFLNDTVVPDISMRDDVNHPTSSFKDVSRSETSAKENVTPTFERRRFLRHSSPIKNQRQPLTTLDTKTTSRQLNVSNSVSQLSSIRNISSKPSKTDVFIAKTTSSQFGSFTIHRPDDAKSPSMADSCGLKRPTSVVKDVLKASSSSKALFDSKTTQGLAFKTSRPEARCPMPLFPVECNRKSILWISNNVNNQKEEILLKNINRDQPVTLSVTIQDSTEFGFPDASRNVELFLNPGETISLPVLFMPSLSSAGQWVYGKLILKPRGFRTENKKFKAVIFLQAKNELPILNFTSERFLARSNGVCDLKLDPDTFVSKIEVANFGSGSAFVVFDSSDEKNILIRPSRFVLKPDHKVVVEIALETVDPNQVVLGRVVAVFGSEVGRVLLKTFGKTRLGSGCKHLDEKVCGEDESISKDCNLQYLTRENLIPIVNSLERFEFDILFFGELEKRNPVSVDKPPAIKFYELVSEETFATDKSVRVSSVDRRWQRASVRNGEIEMAVNRDQGDSAVMQIVHRDHFPESESEDRMREDEDSEMAFTADQRSSSSSVPAATCSDRDQIYLARTTVSLREKVTAKIGIKNRTTSFQDFEFAKLEPPFYSAFKKFTVRPNFYLNIPIKFIPDTSSHASVYESEAVLRNSTTGSILRCSLIGTRDSNPF